MKKEEYDIKEEDEKRIILTEKEADTLFDLIVPVLVDYNLISEKEDWKYLYDSEEEDRIHGFLNDTDLEKERQIDFFQLGENYTFHYWANEIRLCLFEINKDGKLVQFIK